MFSINNRGVAFFFVFGQFCAQIYSVEPKTIVLMVYSGQLDTDIFRNIRFQSSKSTSSRSLLGLPDCEIYRLQRAQNSAARLLTGTRRREHITPI
jgi:hypothetical protein